MPRASTKEQSLLTTAEVAVRLRLSIRTIQRMRATGELPCIVTGDRKVLFDEADLDAYLTRKRSA